jgi:putative FmdB family regulatory protein
VPLYEYQCKKCKHKFEKIQKFSDRPIKKCPECGSPVVKIQHAPNVQFKGSGWYVTDYGGKSDKSKSDGSSEKGTEKGGSDKKETTAKEDGSKAKDKDSGSKKSESKKSESKKSKD